MPKTGKNTYFLKPAERNQRLIYERRQKRRKNETIKEYQKWKQTAI